MPKTNKSPSRPSIRRSGARKVLSEIKATERKVQIETEQKHEKLKNRAITVLQKKQEEILKVKGESRERGAAFAQKKMDAVESFKESRRDRFAASLSANLNVMIQAVQKAGRSLTRDFGEIEKLQISKKGAADFASTADLNSEKTLREYLLKVRPRYGFLQEEGGSIEGEDTSHRWIIDPLDGTTNFLHGVPHFAISLALQQDNEIIAGVIYNPVIGDLFYAEKGGGAWAMTNTGSYRLHVSSRSKLEEAVVTTGVPHLGHGNPERFVKQVMPMMQKSAGVRRMGAASLDMAYVAAGKFECYFEEGIKTWDIAAGMLLVKESGGRVSTIAGDENQADILTAGSILASNDAMFNTFKKIMKDAETA